MRMQGTGRQGPRTRVWARGAVALALLLALLIVPAARPVAADHGCTRAPWPSFREVAPTARRVVVGTVSEDLWRTDAPQRTYWFTLDVDEVLRGSSPARLEIKSLRSGLPRRIVTDPHCEEYPMLWTNVGKRIAIAFDGRVPGIAKRVSTVAFIDPAQGRQGAERLTLRQARRATGTAPDGSRSIVRPEARHSPADGLDAERATDVVPSDDLLVASPEASIADATIPAGKVREAPSWDLSAVIAQLDPTGIPFTYECEGIRFTAEDLAAAPRADTVAPPIPYPAVDPEEAEGLSEWRVIDTEADQLGLLATRNGSSFEYLRMSRGGPGWEYDGNGQCVPTARFPNGLGGYWRLDQSQEQPGSGTQKIHVKTWYLDRCHAGQVRGRPHVEMTDAAVLVAIPMSSSVNSDACSGGRPVRLTIELPEPLGDRQLYDAGSLPLRPVGAAFMSGGTGARTAVAQVDDVKVRLTLDDDPLVAGKPTWITTKVKNVGDTEITYTTDSCENAVGVWGAMIDERWRMGEPADAQAIEAGGRNHYYDLRWRAQEWTIVGSETIGLGFAAKGVPDASDWACADVAIGHRVPPGGVVEQRLRWDGQALGRLGPPPDGLARITGSFDFRRPGTRGEQAVEVELEVPVTEGRDTAWLHPMEVVDAALADDSFRALIEPVAIGDHFGEVIFYDAARGVWVVGACADYTTKLGRWKAAVLHPATGEVKRILNKVTGEYCNEGPWK